VTVTFSGLKPLVVGQHLHTKFWHCGQYGRNEGRTVFLRKPELIAVTPPTLDVPSSDPTAFALHGRHFRPGALMWFEGAGLVNTTFNSTTDVLGRVAGHHVRTPRTVQVMVHNPDGQFSNGLQVTLVARPTPPPPPPPPTPPQAPVGFDELVVHNCNTDHRDVHIWKRDLTTGGPWQFVETLSHEYSSWGTCPAPGSEGTTIDLPDGHDVAIVAIDPEKIGCIAPGGNTNAADPPATPDDVNQACHRDVIIERGKSGGGTKRHHIG
jgi:hypothetical protein